MRYNPAPVVFLVAILILIISTENFAFGNHSNSGHDVTTPYQITLGDSVTMEASTVIASSIFSPPTIKIVADPSREFPILLAAGVVIIALSGAILYLKKFRKQKISKQAVSRPKFCRICGSPLSEKDKFCGKCGKALLIKQSKN